MLGSLHGRRPQRYAPEDLVDLGYCVAYALAEENVRLGRSVVADSVNPLNLTRDAWLKSRCEQGCARLRWRSPAPIATSTGEGLKPEISVFQMRSR